MRLPPHYCLYNFNVPAPQSIAEVTKIGVRTDKATTSQHYGYARYDYGMHLLKDPSVVRPEMPNDARFGWKKESLINMIIFQYFGLWAHHPRRTRGLIMGAAQRRYPSRKASLRQTG